MGCLGDRHQLFRSWDLSDTSIPQQSREVGGISCGLTGQPHTGLPGSPPSSSTSCCTAGQSARALRNLTACRPLFHTLMLRSCCEHMFQAQHCNLVWCDQGFYCWGENEEKGERDPAGIPHALPTSALPRQCSIPTFTFLLLPSMDAAMLLAEGKETLGRCLGSHLGTEIATFGTENSKHHQQKRAMWPWDESAELVWYESNNNPVYPHSLSTQ